VAAAAVLGWGVTSVAAADRLAQPRVGSASVEFQPLMDNAGFELSVSTPDGSVLRYHFAAGQTPAFSLFDAAGQVRQDGSYTYELRRVPIVSPDVRQRLAAARARGGDGPRLAAEPAQTGSLTIVGGGFADLDREETASGPRSVTDAVKVKTAPDFVIADDLIVQGSTCTGFDCVNGEAFSFDTIRLKENSTRLTFIDTSAAGFPQGDWQVRANDATGSNLLAIDWLGTGAVDGDTPTSSPLVIEGSASSNSIYVDSTGRVGFRTATPVLDLHVSTSNTPALRLEQNNSGGFTAQTWDVAGNEASFFVRDVTGGSRLPFRIRPGAPSSSIDISADGDVGIGTGSPVSALDVDAGKITIGGHNIGERVSDITDLEVQSLRNTIYGIDSDSNSVNASFSISRNSDPNSVIFVAREDFLTGINRQTPTFPLHVGTDATNGNGAHVTAVGIWTDGSSRVNKDNIRALDTQDAFSALVNLEPVRYTGKNAPDNEEYLGFIAEDVPELVAMNSRTGLSPMDIVAVLTKVAQEQQKTIAELRQELDQVRAQDHQKTIAELQQQIDQVRAQIQALSSPE
jgi:hypothetical protein